MHDIFSRLFNKVGNVSVQLLQNEISYMIAMIITCVDFRNDYKWQI
jgi:hypothetical protein